MAQVRQYQDLIAWQKARVLVSDVYRVTGGWPKDEQYGLTNQIRRAAVSVPANIAEGQGRGSDKEFAHFSVSPTVRSTRSRRIYSSRSTSPMSRLLYATASRRKQRRSVVSSTG